MKGRYGAPEGLYGTGTLGAHSAQRHSALIDIQHVILPVSKRVLFFYAMTVSIMLTFPETIHARARPHPKSSSTRLFRMKR